MNEKKYRFDLIRAIQICYFIILPFSFLIFSYFRVDLISSVIFRSNDGQCDPSREGIGIHCFGDFHEGLVSPSDLGTVGYKNHYWLSPMDAIISRISSLLNIFASERAILFVAIGIYIFALLIPIIDVRKNLNRTKDAGVVTLIYIGSFPLLASFDRMNSISLAAPLCYFFFFYLLTEKSQKISLFFVLICVFKPQLLLLVVPIFIFFGFKVALKNLLFGLTGIVIVIISQHNFHFNSLKLWILTIIDFGAGKQVLSEDYPNNISFSRMIYFVSSRLGIAQENESVPALIAFVISMTILLLVIFLRNKLDKADALLVILSIAVIGFSKVTGTYYLILILMLELARFRSGNETIFSEQANQNKQRIGTHLRKYLYLIILVPIPIPIFGYFSRLDINEQSQNIIPLLNPILTSIAILITCTVIVVQGFSKQKQDFETLT